MSEDEIINCLSKEECDLKEELGFDSLIMVELVVEIETQYNIEFDMNELDINVLKKFTSLRKLVEKYIGESQNGM